jgi:hypothetical protein
MLRTSTLLTAALMTLTITSDTVSAHTITSYEATDSSRETQLCMAIARDKKTNFQKAVRDSGLSMKHVKRSLRCNEKTIEEFAYQHSAKRILAMLSDNKDTMTAKVN